MGDKNNLLKGDGMNRGFALCLAAAGLTSMMIVGTVVILTIYGPDGLGVVNILNALFLIVGIAVVVMSFMRPRTRRP